MALPLLFNNQVMAKGGGREVNFLFRDDFITAEAAPLTSPRTAEPGPGSFTITDVGNLLDIVGGELVWSGQNAVNDPQIEDANGFSRAAGLAFYCKIKIGNNSDRNQLGFWDGTDTRRLFFDYTSAGNTLIGGHYDNVFVGNLQDSSGAGNYDKIWGICRSAGVFHILNNKLIWIGGTDNSDPVNFKSGTIAFNTSQIIDTIRVVNLPANGYSIWADDYGIATERLAGARTAGDTFTHEADCLIEFTVATLPSSGQIELWLRKQDATNYWAVTVNASGDLELDEVVGGTPTQRGSALGVIAAGERIVVVADDETIKVFDSTTRHINHASAANFKTDTSGELDTEGTGGAVTDIVSYPRNLSAVRAGLDAVENA